MDNLCHTLAGAALAQAGLKHRTPLGTATLLVAANLPALDALAYLRDPVFALAVRRGWTHGLLAMVVLPPLLAGAMLGWDRLVRRRRARAPARPGPLLLLAALGIWSHPLLDLLNTYGVRLLAPFSDRWFYGDALFIVDPWLWLLLGGAAGLAAWRERGEDRGRAGRGREAAGARLARARRPGPEFGSRGPWWGRCRSIPSGARCCSTWAEPTGGVRSAGGWRRIFGSRPRASRTGSGPRRPGPP